MKRIVVLLAVFVLLISSMAGSFAEEDGLFIGVCFDSATDVSGIAQKESFQAAADARGWRLVIADAGGAMEKQLADCEDLIAQGVDYLIVKPQNSDGILPIVEQCAEEGVQLIMHERIATGKTEGVDFLFQTINDQVVQGSMCGQYVVDTFGTEQPVKIVEIRGTEGAQDVTNRAQGFRDSLTPNCEIIVEQVANWNRSEAQRVMQNIIQSTGGDFDVVFSHNDEMGLGVMYALMQAGLTDKCNVTIDGQIEAIRAVRDGNIAFLMSSDRRWGEVVFSNIEKVEAGEEYEVLIIGEEVPTTQENASEVLWEMWGLEE